MRSDTSLCTVLKSGAGERGRDQLFNQHFLEKERFHNDVFTITYLRYNSTGAGERRSNKEKFTYSQYIQFYVSA